MIGLDKMILISKNFEVYDSMMMLHEKVRDKIRSYCYMIKTVNAMEERGLLTTKKEGRNRVITSCAGYAVILKDYASQNGK